MQSFPIEIVFEILSKGEPEDAIRQCSTNKMFSQVCSLQSFWKVLFRMKFPYLNDIEGLQDWKNAYQIEIDRRRAIREKVFSAPKSRPILVSKDAMEFLYRLPDDIALDALPFRRGRIDVMTSYNANHYIFKDKYNAYLDHIPIKPQERSIRTIHKLSHQPETYFYGPNKSIILGINMEILDAADVSTIDDFYVYPYLIELLSEALEKIPISDNDALRKRIVEQIEALRE